MSMGGGPRGRAGTSSAAASSPSTSSLQVEESFSLVRENPLNFGMAIKLAPDLVEEIKRVEAQGGTARIRFGANANGNVIHVGDKTFKFTWSREPGDLCDIYEERRSGDGGSGLLVESGGTWRKLNVERELDESTKNHVKRRSEEAERKLKSRKAIVLDHQNPSMKNQMKAFAASESNQWRNFKNRKEPPFKKPKSETTTVTTGGPPKSVFKPGLPTTTLSKGRLSAGSPLSSQPEQLGPPTSPVGSGDLMKGHTVVSEFAASQNLNKVSSSEKDVANRRNSTISEKSKYNRNIEAKPADLRSLITSLLLEHHSTGMSLKALEKAIGDAMPNSARKIEPILKQIANYQTPGRYFLKPGMETESFKKLPQSGSSPEINCDQSPAPQKFDQLPAQDPSIPMRTTVNNEELGELNPTAAHTTDITEKLDTVQNSPEHLSDKNVSNNSEGVAGSSSDSGSDSDSSDSSDSGSDSGSHSKSKSRSPVGSRSGSSSDSDTDASSSSKQASDEDVDIMTSDDDKESKLKLQDPDPTASRNPVLWSNLVNESVDIGNFENQDPHVSDVIEIDIEKDSPEGDHGAEMPAPNHLFANKEGEEPTDEIKPSSADHYEQERRVSEKKTYDDGLDSMVKDGFKLGQSGTQGRSSKGNSKRRLDDKHSDGRTHSKKRSKSKNSIEPVSGAINSIFGESPYNSSPDRPLQGPDKRTVDLMEDRTTRNDSNYPDIQTGPNQSIYRPVSDSQHPAQRSSEARVWTEAASGEKRPGKHNSLDRGVKYTERSIESLQIQKGFNTEAQSEDGLVNERRQLKFSTEGVGDKHAPIVESHNRKPEMIGKVKETGPSINSYRGYSPQDNNPNTADRSPVMNGRSSSVLRREHSDLELGEFREPFHEATPASKKQFERKSSFKHMENKQMDAEYWNSDFSGGKTSNKIPADSGKMSPPNSEAAISNIPDGPNKRKAQENYVDDLTRPHPRSSRPLDPHHQPRGDLNSQQNNIPEMSGKSRFAEAGMGRSASVEAYGDTSRKMAGNSTEQPQDPVRGVGVDARATKHSKKQKAKMAAVSNDRRIDALTGSNDSRQKKKLSSSDETSCSFTKFEKEEPELKVPIRDISQYKEYVKEYQEKYESYCSLNKILESYRDEFSKLGKDLEAYKGRDMKRYNDILEQMRSSFRQCGEKHKRLKKIFVVLYEELKGFTFSYSSKLKNTGAMGRRILNDALRTIVNAEKRGFASAELKPISHVVASFLQIMKYRGYIKDFQVHDPHRVGRITVQLQGRVNDCRALTYRQDIKAHYIENYKTRMLPTRQWGYVVVTTPNGVLDHEEAIRQNVGGQVIGYFY
ncbi:ribosomal protein S15A E [Perilla frutescens var. hirtella]|uniref:Small ribosomal subunit protein uS8c n=1 Tax=Perilla frutescens var. hirtella TaxID=608512 RepID=A0AAD4JCQ3_PERFH|nr:ribosomal protein S15A E [Perilla frutescens var. hirtella]